MHFQRHVGSVFHSCVEAQKINVDSVPQSCGAACVHFHRHVGSVCSTVVWRGLCAFPQACGECVFHSCVEGLVCISTGMWGVCSIVVWRVCVYFHRHVAVCFTVVWRFCVCISIGSVCSTVMWRGLCAFPQTCGECVFHSCVEA